ncbi:MAG: hypothetical protein ACOYL6_00860 [Bacteriovoracaceae bacterium]
MSLGRLVFFLINLVLPISSFAQTINYLNRAPKGLLLGDAYTAAVDDEYGQYYNPASLARSRDFSFTPFQADFGLTNVLAEQERYKDFPKKDAVAIADRVMGVPLYAHAATSPSIKMAGFGFSLLASQNANVILRDKTTPVIDIDYRYDRGYVAGYAFSFGKGKPKKKKTKKKDKGASTFTGEQTSFGYNYKSIYRDSLVGTFPLFGTELINIISASGSLDYHSIRNQLGYSRGHGIGHDVGMEHTIWKGNTELNFGLSVMDVGNTRFKRTEGIGDIPDQQMMVMSGVSFKQDWAFFDYRFSFDLQPLNLPIEFNRKVHAGFEVGPKIVKLLAGYNGGYLSYGAIVDLFLIRVMAGFYGVETGTKFRQAESKRALIYFSLLDFSFDVL